MFRLKGTYFGLVLNPLQKLFRRSSPRGEEFFTPGCNLVDLSTSPTLSLPDSLQVALLLHRVKERIERSSTQVDFESVPDLQVDLVPPSRLCLEEAQDD